MYRQSVPFVFRVCPSYICVLFDYPSISLFFSRLSYILLCIYNDGGIK